LNHQGRIQFKNVTFFRGHCSLLHGRHCFAIHALGNSEQEPTDLAVNGQTFMLGSSRGGPASSLLDFQAFSLAQESPSKHTSEE